MKSKYLVLEMDTETFELYPDITEVEDNIKAMVEEAETDPNDIFVFKLVDVKITQPTVIQWPEQSGGVQG